MALIQNIPAFLITLGILVVFHELGHYWVARLCGVKILRFSVGMGKVIYSRKFGKDQTEWAISMLPLGGYVKMLDARDPDVGKISEPDLSREFCQQSVWKRIAIVAAGPVANFLLAICIFSGLFLYGVPQPTTKIRVSSEHSLAYQAGFRYGDVITAINGQHVQTWSDLQLKILQFAIDKRSVDVDVVRKLAPDANQQYSFVLPLNQISSKDLEQDFLSVLGISVARPEAVLAKVLPDGAAVRAGLMDGDTIAAINGNTLLDGIEFSEIIAASAGKEITLSVRRKGQQLELKAIPDPQVVDGKTVGRLNVQLTLDPELITPDLSISQSISLATEKTWDTSTSLVRMLGKMVVGDVSLKNITGPLTIADYAGQTARIGLISFLSFIASVSISLGVMNLLPIPVLDGGHLLYYSLEVLTGKPVSERFSEIAQRVGVGLLLSMMALAFFNDIVRLMS